jgi:hypothetical protein
MNEHTLPDDFSRWPNNPFELLGVRPGVGERDLRRAYARLIRIFKPEQFPEHFRRIREAYEAVRHYTQFFTSLEAPADSPTLAAESPPAANHLPETPEAGNPSTPAAERPVPQSQPRSLEEELDEAWNWAVDGDEARAYARLLELHNRYPERSEICLRLHGLLRVSPELDPVRTPCDFVALGLRRTGGSGPCWELYRREIEDNSGEALTERFAELLHTTSQPGLLATFVQWRWSAAGRQERFEVIGDDLPGLRARLAVDHEETWLRLLASAADQLAWARAPTNSAGLLECLHEAARHEHLQLRCADVFDRLEYLERVAGGWHSLMKKGTVSADLLELLSRFWTRPFSEIRRSVTALLAAIDTETDVWLACLDRIHEASPPLLSLFGHMLDSYRLTLNLAADERDPAELAVLARHFLEEYGGLRYRALRPRLLAFCLREMIHPDVIAQLARSQTVVLPEARLNKLVNDWPLRHVYRACTLFRI